MRRVATPPLSPTKKAGKFQVTFCQSRRLFMFYVNLGRLLEQNKPWIHANVIIFQSKHGLQTGSSQLKDESF